MTLHELRRNYTFGELTRAGLSPDPIEQFQKWFDELRQADLPEWFESNAMTLSTCRDSGGVSSRIVLLKSISSQGFTFFSNYRSAKAKQLEANPRAALNFFWPMFERQVRIEGQVHKVASDISDDYFQQRPRRSQLGAIASPQSEVIGESELLAQRVEELEKQYLNQTIPRPAHWGGFILTPDVFEFWQGKPSRLHDRFQYRWTSASWKIERLAP